MTALIGLAGAKRSGKDTFASALVEQFGWARVAFADAIREAALRLDPIVVTSAPPHDGPMRLSEVVEVTGWELAKDHYPEVRRTLQRLGSEAIRTVDSDFWIRAALVRIFHAMPTAPGVVVTDVRFPNEVEALKDHGGSVYRIVRPGPRAVDEHVSESALDGYNLPDIRNDGTIADLQAIAHGIGIAFS